MELVWQVLDADQAAFPDFLTKTLPCMDAGIDSDNVALVQSPQVSSTLGNLCHSDIVNLALKPCLVDIAKALCPKKRRHACNGPDARAVMKIPVMFEGCIASPQGLSIKSPCMLQPCPY